MSGICVPERGVFLLTFQVSKSTPAIPVVDAAPQPNVPLEIASAETLHGLKDPLIIDVRDQADVDAKKGPSKLPSKTHYNHHPT